MEGIAMERRKEWIGLFGIPVIVLASAGMLYLNLSEEYLGVMETIVRLLVMFGIVALLRPVLGEHWRAFQKKRWTKWVWIFLGIISLQVILMAVRAILPPVESTAVEVLDEGIDYLEVSWGEFFLFAFASLTPVATAIVEECTFRYLMLEKLLDDQKVKTIALVLVNGFLFGVIHYYNVGGFYNTIPYMFAGLFLACVYVKTRNLWMVLGIHVLYNGLLSVVAVLILGIARLFA